MDFGSDLQGPRVSLPSVNSTTSFWLDLPPEESPLANVGSTGPLTQDADICVIGSGVTGVGCVWHLLKGLQERRDGAKIKVVLIEARSFCSGATGRNGGHLTPTLFSRFISREKIYGRDEAVKSYLLERHTADTLLKFINDRPGLAEKVDLVAGGMLQALTEKDETQAKRDWEEAVKAGIDMGNEGVRWVGRDEMVEEFGLEPSLGYAGVKIPGHNLWPYKLVTRVFQDAQATADERGDIEVILHTKTPVTGFERNYQYHGQPKRDATTETASEPPEFSKQTNGSDAQRRWKVQTSRGSISCNYVVHATNGYAAHLLPFLAGQGPVDTATTNGHTYPAPFLAGPGLANTCTHPEATTSPQITKGFQHPLSRSSPPISSKPMPRGMYGIVPTRGQVGAVRASVPAADLGWRNSWVGIGEGWEYWFPRYQGLEGTMNGSDIPEIKTGTGSRSGSENVRSTRNPLIILGGGREYAGEDREFGKTDDGVLNERVSNGLRKLLPNWFPGKFENGEDGWEMEWTGIMGYTKTGDPFVGPVVPLFKDADKKEYEGHYISAGYHGHGMPRAFACAEAVAGMIKADIVGESWDVPAWLPKRYLTWATEA